MALTQGSNKITHFFLFEKNERRWINERKVGCGEGGSAKVEPGGCWVGGKCPMKISHGGPSMCWGQHIDHVWSRHASIKQTQTKHFFFLAHWINECIVRVFVNKEIAISSLKLKREKWEGRRFFCSVTRTPFIIFAWNYVGEDALLNNCLCPRKEQRRTSGGSRSRGRKNRFPTE